MRLDSSTKPSFLQNVVFMPSQVIFLFQYMELIEQFKELHKEAEQLKDSGMSAGEIKRVSFLYIFN